MKVTITARHARFSDRMKKYAREKAQHLAHYFDPVRKIEVILDAEGEDHCTVEMIASAVLGHVLVCHARESTAMAALDVVADKMERQLTKLKEKLCSKHSPHAGARPGKYNGGRAQLVPGANTGNLWW